MIGDQDEAFKAGQKAGEERAAIMSDLTFIRATMVRIEGSLARGGERMGGMEDKIREQELDIATIKKDVESTSKAVSSLDESRSRFIWSILASWVAAIGAFVYKKGS